jgi:molybdopterin-dependent oxidoreductase alpha subunit
MKKPQAQNPEVFGKLHLENPPQNSVGWGALVSSVEQMGQNMNAPDALRASLKMNQKGGFDCPGCAWPDPDDERSVLGEYCENGIKALAEEATNRRIGAAFFAEHSVAEISEWTDFEIGKQGRIVQPMVIGPSDTHYQPIGWADAFGLIASELKALNSPHEAVFYTSGRTSNEAAFLYQLFVRMYGTNNLPDCSNMCHESSGAALSQTLGIGKGSVTLEDFYQAEVVVVMGQNPATNHPRMLSALEKCKENGGKIISINPLPEVGLMRFTNPQRPLKMLTGGTPLSDVFLQVRINGDVPLLKAIMRLLLEADAQQPGSVLDWDFIREKTNGLEAFVAQLQRESFAQLVADSGVSEEKIREAAALLIPTRKIIVCWAMGLTQHQNAVDNIREVVNLLLLKGAIGKPGAGTCPVRGHSNVQGDRTMGIWEAPKPAFLDKLQTVFGFDPPRAQGYSTVEAIEAMYRGEAKVFVALGGNFLSATPDTEFTAKAFQHCRLTVQVSTKLNRSHLIHGQRALILPCLGRTDVDVQASGEQFVTCENSMGVVQASKGVLEPPSEHLKSEVAIVCELAEATLGSKLLNWLDLRDDYGRIRDLIEQTISDFEQFNERIQQPEGFYLPNAAREGVFQTTTQKANFSINTYQPTILQAGELLMMTIRSHDQFNTTIYGLNDRYRGIFNERRVVLMNRDDMAERGLKARQAVYLSSHYGQVREARHFLVVPYNIPRGCVATYFPEANVLVPLDLQAHTSKTPVSKSVVVRVVPA